MYSNGNHDKKKKHGNIYLASIKKEIKKQTYLQEQFSFLSNFRWKILSFLLCQQFFQSRATCDRREAFLLRKREREKRKKKIEKENRKRRQKKTEKEKRLFRNKKENQRRGNIKQ